jgi:hypothetical protein
MEEEDERRIGVVWIARKGDMRSAPVRARVFSVVLEMRDV